MIYSSLFIISITAIAIVLYRFFRLKSALLEKEKIIHHKDIQLNEKINSQLKETIETKNRELTGKILSMQQTNEILDKLSNKLNYTANSLSTKGELQQNIHQIAKEIEQLTQNELWVEFNEVFKSIHNNFYDQLLNIAPHLSPTEIKIAALLRMNLNTKDIADITFKSESGIKSARYRLRKKLDLASNDNLVAFLMRL